MSPFKQKVIYIIRMIPYAKVASYGQVALYAGTPRSAREVGWILNSTEGSPIDLPWWRVVNNKGYLSIRGTVMNDKEVQKKLLRAEGIEVTDGFMLDMETYRWRISETEVKKLQLPEEYIERILTSPIQANRKHTKNLSQKLEL